MKHPALFSIEQTCIVLPLADLLVPEVPCLNGVAGDPVRLIMSGEPAGESRGLWLGLALEFTVIPVNECVKLSFLLVLSLNKSTIPVNECMKLSFLLVLSLNKSTIYIFLIRLKT